jgi:2-keto-4-pentenoate hydratase
VRLSDIGAAGLARELVDARSSLVPVARPDNLSLAAARAIKTETLRQLTADGTRAIVGYKVSLGATWGALTDDVAFTGPTELPRDDFFDPLLEGELVFLADAVLDSDSSIDDILDRCRVASGIEIADSRWKDWLPRDPSHFRIPSEIEIEADNAVCGGLVVSEMSRPARDMPLPDVDVAVQCNGAEVARQSLSRVMGHPAAAVRWLLQLLGADGIDVRPGQLISSGCPYSTFVTVPPVGGIWQAAIDGLDCATLTFTASGVVSPR